MGRLIDNNNELLNNTNFILDQEKKELELWFNDYYTVHEQKYNRLIAIGKLNDDGSSPSESLNALYQEAESKRARIQEIEEIQEVNDDSR